MTRGRREPLADRFWRMVDENGPVFRPELGACHIWTGSKDRDGYGKIGSGNGKEVLRAPRVAVMLADGVMPPPKVFVCHRCDNPPCVRRSHLFLGDNSANIRDAVAKGVVIGKPHYGEAHGRALLTAVQVDEIRRRYAAGETQVALGREYGVARPTIGNVVRGESWRGACATSA